MSLCLCERVVEVLAVVVVGRYDVCEEKMVVKFVFGLLQSLSSREECGQLF